MSVLAWLDSLPPSAGILLSVALCLLSALIVAVVSRRSVMTQISNENSRFQRKLEHDAQEKATDRAMQMKQEVFMPACEALTSASQLLSKFADADMPREKHQQLLAEVAPRLYRVHTIANDATVRALITAHECFVAALLELERARLPIARLRVDLAQTTETLRQTREVETSLAAKLAQLQISGPNEGLHQYLVGRLGSATASISELEKKSSELSSRIFGMQMQLASKALHAAMDFEGIGTKAILAMRTELQFPINAEQYEAALCTARNNAKAQCDKLTADLLQELQVEPSSRANQ